jgi:NIMA-interacting peptidyl-prolyl cis-trans isomerase 1
MVASTYTRRSPSSIVNPDAQTDSLTGLPPNWTVRYSKSKSLPYYFNTSDNTSQWEPPRDANAEVLKTYMSTQFTAPPAAPSTAPEGKIRAAHLLVKHCNSRRASSWKQAEITRTPEEARKILEGYENQIKTRQVTLGELASSESDCSSARKRGDLGYFGRGEMQKEFEDAAFALEKGEMSGIVETASGLHLIER